MNENWAILSRYHTNGAPVSNHNKWLEYNDFADGAIEKRKQYLSRPGLVEDIPES